jgi:hypothetical protein
MSKANLTKRDRDKDIKKKFYTTITKGNKSAIKVISKIETLIERIVILILHIVMDL